MNVSTYVCMHACMYTRTHIHTHTYTHTNSIKRITTLTGKQIQKHSQY